MLSVEEFGLKVGRVWYLPTMIVFLGGGFRLSLMRRALAAA